MNNKVRVLVVEDEFITLNNLRRTLQDVGYEISGDAMKAEEAIAVLEKGNTDIAMLDINLKGEKTGLWVAEQINKKYKIPFIFLSALSDAKTIETAALTEPSGYLVKPFSTPDIYAAIEVALKTFSKKKETAQLPESHTEAASELLINDTIFVKDDLIYRRIKIGDIEYVQAFKNYLELHFGGSRHIIRSTLKDFFQILPSEHFVQTHRSFVININFVEKIGNQFVLVKTADIPITNKFKEEVLKRMRFFK